MKLYELAVIEANKLFLKFSIPTSITKVLKYTWNCPAEFVSLRKTLRNSTKAYMRVKSSTDNLQKLHHFKIPGTSQMGQGSINHRNFVRNRADNVGIYKHAYMLMTFKYHTLSLTLSRLTECHRPRLLRLYGGLDCGVDICSWSLLLILETGDNGNGAGSFQWSPHLIPGSTGDDGWLREWNETTAGWDDGRTTQLKANPAVDGGHLNVHGRGWFR